MRNSTSCGDITGYNEAQAAAGTQGPLPGTRGRRCARHVSQYCWSIKIEPPRPPGPAPQPCPSTTKHCVNGLLRRLTESTKSSATMRGTVSKLLAAFMGVCLVSMGSEAIGSWLTARGERGRRRPGGTACTGGGGETDHFSFMHTPASSRAPKHPPSTPHVFTPRCYRLLSPSPCVCWWPRNSTSGSPFTSPAERESRLCSAAWGPGVWSWGGAEMGAAERSSSS